MSEKEKIEWDVLQCGQPSAYKDSIYIYRIKSEQHENVVLGFCTKVLNPCSKLGSGFDGSSGFDQKEGHGLDAYYSFSKESEGVYVYKVCHPFCD